MHKLHNYNWISFYKVNIKVSSTLCVDASWCLNVNWVSSGPLVIVLHLLSFTVVSELLSGFHSSKRALEYLFFALRSCHHCVRLSSKHNCDTLSFCWDVLISDFLLSVFRLLVILPFPSHYFVLCLFFIHSINIWN